MTKFKIAGLALPLLALSGCADTQTYPIGWPEPVASLTGGCSALDGVYFISDSDSRLFLDHFSGADTGAGELADRVRISAPAKDILEIVAYREEAVVAQRQFSEQGKTLSCGSTGAVLTYYSGIEKGDGAYCYLNVKRSLSKDTDGFLIMKAESTCSGSYKDTPIGGKNTSWIRFQPEGFGTNSMSTEQ